jgi:hypothetical protein
LFLSAKIERITVFINILKKKGAWPSESPHPMDVTTATRFTPNRLHASIT